MRPPKSSLAALSAAGALALAACSPAIAAERTFDAPAAQRQAKEGRGLKTARGTIHLHSVRSHDACDGMPLPGGMPSQPCYQHLRDALCITHQDYAMLTDHDDSMADTAWADLFIPGPGDEPIMKGGMQVASRVSCADGHRVVVTAERL